MNRFKKNASRESKSSGRTVAPSCLSLTTWDSLSEFATGPAFWIVGVSYMLENPWRPYLDTRKSWRLQTNSFDAKNQGPRRFPDTHAWRDGSVRRLSTKPGSPEVGFC